ncbi:GntR family transcriptional regulator [soil metagenome]
MLGASQEMFSVDRNTAVPLYHQIYVQLRDEIVSGARAFGSLVPTEQDISDSYGVSRITARRALDELAAQHFVARKRRVGTQVIYNLPVRPIEANIAKAVDSLVTFGRKTKVTVIETGKEDASESVASLLGVDVGTRVVRAVRLRWLDGEPLGCTIAHVPEEFEFVINERNLMESPILSLITQTGRQIGSANQTIAAVSADPAMAAALKIDAMEPLLRITRAFRDTEGAPLLLTRAFYRADRYQVRVDLLSSTLQPEVAV